MPARFCVRKNVTTAIAVFQDLEFSIKTEVAGAEQSAFRDLHER